MNGMKIQDKSIVAYYSVHKTYFYGHSIQKFGNVGRIVQNIIFTFVTLKEIA